MTAKKGKFNFWDWLLYTQLHEIYEADTPSERAKEEADLVNVVLQDLEESGFDPVSVFSKRAEDKSDDFGRIVTIYRNKFKETIEQAKEMKA